MANEDKVKAVSRRFSFTADPTIKDEPTVTTETTTVSPSGDVSADRMMVESSGKASVNKDAKTVEYASMNGENQVTPPPQTSTPQKRKASKNKQQSNQTQQPALQPNEPYSIKDSDLTLKDIEEQKEEDLQPSSADDFAASLIKNVSNVMQEPTIPTGNDNNQIGRFNWNIEHGLTNKFWIDDWRKNAQVENQMLKTKAGKPSSSSGSDRAAVMKQKLISDKWDKTISRFEKGNYDYMNGDTDWNTLQNDLSRIAEAYARAGGDPSTLSGFGLNKGGFAARTTEAVKNKTIENDMLNYRKELRNDLATRQYGDWSLKGKYDKIIEQIGRVIGGSSGNQADADKIRIQYLYLPENKVREFQTNFKNYLMAMKDVGDKAGSDEAKKAINSRVQRATAAIDKAVTSHSVGNGVAAVLEMYNALSSEMHGLTAIGEVRNVNNDIWKNYVENTIREAEIDPRVLENQLAVAQRIARERYNEIVRQKGGRKLNVTDDIAKGDDPRYENYKQGPSVGIIQFARAAERPEYNYDNEDGTVKKVGF